MPGVVKHAWTHRPKWQGGTDPIDPQLVYAHAYTTLAPTVTADAELEFEVCVTTDGDTFKFDDSDPKGVLIKRPGLYQFYAYVFYAVGSIAVPRLIYTTVQRLSSGPLAGLGDEAGEGLFALGSGQNQSGVGQVTAANTINKSQLNHVALKELHDSPTPVSGDPYRAAVILDHAGTNYTLNGGIRSTLTIVRVGPIATTQAPAP